MALVITEREGGLVPGTALVTLEDTPASERSQAGKDQTTRFHLYYMSRMAPLGGQRDEQSQQVGEREMGVAASCCGFSLRWRKCPENRQPWWRGDFVDVFIKC